MVFCEFSPLQRLLSALVADRESYDSEVLAVCLIMSYSQAEDTNNNSTSHIFASVYLFI